MCGPAAIGAATTLDRREIQEGALRFYDKPRDVDRHSDSRASLVRYSRPLMGPAAVAAHRHLSYHPRSRACSKSSYTQEPTGEKRHLQQKMATGTTIGTTLPLPDNSVQPKSWMTGKMKLVYQPTQQEILTGSIVFRYIRRLLTQTWRKCAVLTSGCTETTLRTRRLGAR